MQTVEYRERIVLRATAQDRLQFERAARKRGVTLSDWIRSILRRSAAAQLARKGS